MTKLHAVLAVAMVAGAATTADAFEIRTRFVERVGNADLVLSSNLIDISTPGARRVRVQYGVFDNQNGAAPAGGFVGWNVGSLQVSGPGNLASETRTPGRLSPFNFASGPNSNGNPPLPGGDPFNMLTEIDATLGTQSPIWQCNAAGVALPQPPAVIRGHNTFVSVFEFTIDPVSPGAYTITTGGNLIAATEWRTVGTPTPPDCGDPADPADDVPGAVTYAPFPTTPQAFTGVLNVQIFVPAPGAGALLGLGGLVLARRRRTR